MSNNQALQSGTILLDYEIVCVLGSGGFGITYKARDRRLDTFIALKEYFPAQLATRRDDQTVVSRPDLKGDGLYSWGLDKFRYEGHSLAKINHPNIVAVNHIFEANNTSYMVLDFIDGESMRDWLKRHATSPTQSELEELLWPLLGAIEAMHQRELLHRDIAPKNIMLTKALEPVLIDFGAAKLLIAQHSQTLANVYTPGYAACEQYSNKGQGPWTDIYALSASLYEAIAGKPPPDGFERVVEDRYTPAAEVGAGRYSPQFLAAIDWGLKPLPKDRPQSVAEWMKALDPERGGAPPAVDDSRIRRMLSIFKRA